MKKRVISLFVSMIMLFSCALVTSATEYAIQPRFTHIYSVSAGLTIDSSTGLATCEGFGSSKANDNTVSITVQLQQYKNGVWTTLKSWSGSDTVSVSVTGLYYVYKGYKYRTNVAVIVYDANGNYLESTIGTQEKTY